MLKMEMFFSLYLDSNLKEKMGKEIEKREFVDLGEEYAICPVCGNRSLRISGGCEECLVCGYSKCDT